MEHTLRNSSNIDSQLDLSFLGKIERICHWRSVSYLIFNLDVSEAVSFIVRRQLLLKFQLFLKSVKVKKFNSYLNSKRNFWVKAKCAINYHSKLFLPFLFYLIFVEIKINFAFEVDGENRYFKLVKAHSHGMNKSTNDSIKL